MYQLFILIIFNSFIHYLILFKIALLKKIWLMLKKSQLKSLNKYMLKNTLVMVSGRVSVWINAATKMNENQYKVKKYE